MHAHNDLAELAGNGSLDYAALELRQTAIAAWFADTERCRNAA